MLLYRFPFKLSNLKELSNLKNSQIKFSTIHRKLYRQNVKNLTCTQNGKYNLRTHID